MAAWTGGILAGFWALCLVQHVAGVFLVEKAGLKITYPTDAKAKYSQGFAMALANFGSPRYGGALMGRVVYLDREYEQDYTCSPQCRYACQEFKKATPRIDFHKEKDPIVLLVDRGPTGPGMEACKFAEKVWNAQQAGAAAVLVANYGEQLTTMTAPDDDDEADHMYLEDINIPASFVTRSTADTLLSLLRTRDKVFVFLDWSDALPKQEKVSLEFWTNSNDQCGAVCDVQKEFIRGFVPVAEEFETKGWVDFTPHYLVWDCPARSPDSATCKSQCIRRGRYCAPDPDGNQWEGYSGAQVVEENLRSLCVFELASAAGKGWLWWEYATRFGDRCDMKSGRYGKPCAESIFEELLKRYSRDRQSSWSSMDKLRACVGDVSADASLPLLDKQRRGERGDASTGEVSIVPTLKVNGKQYRGRLATSDVLRAICAGFAAGARPDACNSQDIGGVCAPGSAAQRGCEARDDGKTKCTNTATGYNCTCGHGFLSRIGEHGREICLDINECLSVSTLEPNCTCERCACKNTYGGYECIADLLDECSHENGKCWQADLRVSGATHHFTACHDNIADYKRALAEGSEKVPPLHTCTCPACFQATSSGGCEPKCDLRYCDPVLGACLVPRGSVSVMTLLGAVVGISVLLIAAGAVAYKLRLRNLMQAEVRAIMAEYMPLQDVEGAARESPHQGTRSVAMEEQAGIPLQKL